MATPAWAQPPPVRLFNQSGLMLDLSLDVLAAAAYFSDETNLNFGGHDPQQQGFTLQNAELTLGATVDPYLRADANIILLIEDGETVVELEEAYFTTLALPYRLQLLGGQFMTRVGRINAQHPHAWDFADQPVINNRFFGPDGLRNPGVQLSWLAPLPVYLVLIASAQNANGETATSFLSEAGETVDGYTLIARDVRHASDLLYMGRVRTAVNPMESVEVVLGGSTLFGPNASDTDTSTTIHGVDLYAKWRPLNAERGFPFVALQVEGMWRHYQTPGNPLHDRGLYAQLLWGFIPRWVAGARVDYADGGDGTDPLRDRRLRLSPNVTFYPSEFSKWRLQYNADLAQHLGGQTLHAVFLQVEFLIGSHGAHTF
jgi:hypothetical protein